MLRACPMAPLGSFGGVVEGMRSAEPPSEWWAVQRRRIRGALSGRPRRGPSLLPRWGVLLVSALPLLSWPLLPLGSSSGQLLPLLLQGCWASLALGGTSLPWRRGAISGRSSASAVSATIPGSGGGRPPDWFRAGNPKAGRTNVDFPDFNDWTRNQAVHTGRGTTVNDWYIAMTNIRVRRDASVSSAPLGTVIREGQVFQVNEELAESGQKYLKLAKESGWVFTKGIAGEWAGKMIVKRK